MDQLAKFELINQQNVILKDNKDFLHILERVGSTKFEKSDLEFYFRTLGEIRDRIDSSRSTIKTFIQILGQFSKPSTRQAISTEAKEQLDNSIIEMILLLKELAVGRESEFTQLEKSFRRRGNG